MTRADRDYEDGEAQVVTRIIDLTPTWRGLLPAMLHILSCDGTSDETRDSVTREFERMAIAADGYVAAQKAGVVQ